MEVFWSEYFSLIDIALLVNFHLQKVMRNSKDLNVRVKTIKLLEENRSEIFLTLN